MKIAVYSIYDNLAETYNKPFVLEKKVSQRTFSFMAKEISEEEAADREIREIGVFDTDTGELEKIYPITVYDLMRNWKEIHDENN